MAEKFYAKSPGNEGYLKNMEVVGFHDLNGVMAFQMALYKTGNGRYYMYCGSFRDRGINIIDVTDPANPRFVKWLVSDLTDSWSNTKTLKIQVADDLMIVGLCGGGVTVLNEVDPSKRGLCGVLIYDLSKDPENPEFLSFWNNDMPNTFGVHRFCYNGGRYVHLSSTCKGLSGLAYRILDIENPRAPKEIGRWWLPEQFEAGMMPIPGVENRHFLDGPGLHAVYVEGDKAYVPCNIGGLCILDISDPTLPRMIGQLKVCPPFAGRLGGARCHTAFPLTGRPYCVLSNEGERFQYFNKDVINGVAQPLNTLHMVDISNPADPVLVAQFPYPEVPADFPYRNFTECTIGAPGPFGPHNLHEPMTGKPWLEHNSNRVYCCYFHAGLRIYDVSDPYYIKEIAYFIPPNPEKMLFQQNLPGKLIATTEDCVVDDRGMIYVSTLHDGMYIVRATV